MKIFKIRYTSGTVIDSVTDTPQSLTVTAVSRVCCCHLKHYQYHSTGRTKASDVCGNSRVSNFLDVLDQNHQIILDSENDGNHQLPLFATEGIF